MCIRDRNYAIHKHFVTQLPNPINQYLASVLDHFTGNFIYTCRFTILQLSRSTHYLLLFNDLMPKIPIPCTIKPTHTFTTTSSLLPMLCRFLKCSHHTLVTFISSATKAPFLFIVLCKFPLFLLY